jgi:uncharacterized membrane protein YgdD (TMEM256/DUF423 family)
MRLSARIGLILIIVGALIFVGQTVALIRDKTAFKQRGEVLTGKVTQSAGTHDVRPAWSVLGVVCLAGGLFAYALSGERKP